MTDEDLFLTPGSIYNTMTRIASGEREHGLIVRDGYALFYSEWPSNWTWSPFSLNGKRYNCVEQWMMASKARLFDDRRALKKIMESTSPADQKRFGREVEGFDTRKWGKVCFDIVVQGCAEKYRQNEDLGKKLLATGNLHFVEASPTDKIWGIGMGKNDPDATKPGRWLGKNLLGKAHDAARKIIREERGL